jgi:3-hydroxyisobutyrate dehydrogenase-like beta-hydroxyacid dehydrogenase
MMEREKAIGFVGFGAMASRMARNLRTAGYGAVVYTPSGRGGSEGDRIVRSAREIGEHADIVIVCVPDDAALDDALYGHQGLLAGMRHDGLVINASSNSPEASAALDRAASALGLTALDAPVSGSTPEADAGDLVILVGGPEEGVRRAQPIFDVIGRLTIHAGPSGAGSKLKLVINGVMAAGMVALAEVVTYGLASGLDHATLLDALSAVAVVSPHHKRKLKNAFAGDFRSQFPTRLMHKDIGLFLNAAAGHTLAVPVMAAVAQLLSQTRRDHADDDYSASLKIAENLAQVRL